jgi:hypothetical protein
LQKLIGKTILPFTVSSQANGFFDSNVEKAAVFCTAELNRQKGGGFFRKQDTEKLVFISTVLYPFWIAPFEESTLIIDGLNIASYTIIYSALPDLKGFQENLKSQSMTRQAHSNCLSNNQNYFQTSNNEQKIIIEGLLNDVVFTGEFLDYIKQAKTTDLPIIEGVLISPCLDEEGLLKMVQKIEIMKKKLSDELASLNEVIKLLNSKNMESQANLQEEIQVINKEYSVKIQNTKAILDDNISKINKIYSKDVTEVSNRFEQKITSMQKDVVRFEKEKNKLDAEIEHAESEIKTSAVNKDDSAEQKWKEKRNQLKDQRPDIISKLKETQKLVDTEEEAKKTSLFQLKQDNEAKIKEASKALLEIEASQDAEIKFFLNEMERIEESTSNIIRKVNELAKNREEKIREFEQLGIRQKRTDHLLVYMPFYLSCYQSKTKKRYTYLAPSDLSDSGFSTRIKTLGKTKISQLFQPRYKKITSILNHFIVLMDENIIFNREIFEACMKANIMQTEKAGELVRNGLIKLKEQSWLSKSEFEEFNQAVTQYYSG